MSDIVRVSEAEKRRRVALECASRAAAGTGMEPYRLIDVAYQLEQYLRGGRDE